MAHQPGTACPCGCRCAVPKAVTESSPGCPCSCRGCDVCGSSKRRLGESAPRRQPGRTPVTETRSTVPTTIATPEQLEALIDRLTESVKTATAAHQAAPAPQPAPVVEAAPLHSLSTDELGRRLVRQLAETHASPWWRPVTENAGDTGALAQRGLAEQAQALPIGQQSMTLAEALASAHDLESPAWRQGAARIGRTIFDQPGR